MSSDSPASSPRSPIRRMVRMRLFTEETVHHQNRDPQRLQSSGEAPPCTTMRSDENPFEEGNASTMVSHVVQNPTGPQEDSISCASDVSSLSRDDTLQRFSLADSNDPANVTLPPTIFVPTLSTTPNWLVEAQETDSTAPVPPPLFTGGPSPAIPRPSFGRGHQQRCNPSFGDRTGAGELSQAVGTLSLASPTLSLNAEVVENTSMASGSQVITRRRSRTQEGPSRPPHIHRRVATSTSFNTISVGSIVGQSSWQTAPATTVTSTSSNLSEQLHMIRANKRLQELSRTTPRRNPVADDLKYLLEKVASPISKTWKKEEKVELCRSSGCLT